MPNKRTSFIILIILIITQSLLTAQGFNKKRKEKGPGIPYFKYEIFSYPIIERDSVRMEVIIKIPYDELQFIKDSDEFLAAYDVSLFVLNSEDKQVYSKVITSEVRLKEYDKTNSNKLHRIHEIGFKLIPDTYKFTIGIRDIDTDKKQFFNKKIKLKDFYEKSVIISEISITEIEDTTQADIKSDSLLNSNEEKKSIMLIKYNLLSEGGPATLKYQILDNDANLIFEESFNRDYEKGISKEILKLTDTNLQYTKYILKVIVELNGEIVSREKDFHLKWHGMSILINDIDIAIEQLKYIADGKTIKALRKAKKEKKREKFEEFWKSKDPTYGTVKNELMDEYYRRIHYANRNFSGFREGWQTDMGLIYVIYGRPDNIERHPFEINAKPYEIWYYQNVDRMFIFVDETGFGEYRLTSPYHMDRY